MADVSLAGAALAVSLAAFNVLSPVSPLDEIRACETARTALRAGAGGADAPFYPTGEGFGSGGGGTITSGTAYETADGWRCEAEQIVRDGRASLEIRIYAPPATR